MSTLGFGLKSNTKKNYDRAPNLIPNATQTSNKIHNQHSILFQMPPKPAVKITTNTQSYFKCPPKPAVKTTTNSQSYSTCLPNEQ